MPDSKKVRYTFLELLNEYKIEIPIMQRDYAQGRMDEKASNIRDNLLNSLFDAINDDNKSIDFDFVYGSKGGSKLLPLDGQQRLTTLFLLHWYLAVKDNMLDNSTASALHGFTYSTRMSSQKFCTLLIKSEIIISEKPDLSKVIKNSVWFFKLWNNDPTIKAMLVMLDAIHRKFYKLTGGFEKLKRAINAKPPVTFYFLCLEDYGLTDALYIKMNARGKHLSDFEKFKAKFFKFLKDKCYKEEADYFEVKIDKEWTDAFWAYKEDNTIDDPFMRFFMFITEMMYGAYNHCLSQDSPFKSKENKMVVDFEVIELTYDNRDKIEFLFGAFDLLNKNEIDKIGLLKQCIIGSNLRLNEKIILFAIIIRKLKIPAQDDSGMDDYIRVIRNLLSRIRQLLGYTYTSNLRYENLNDIYGFITAISDKNEIYKELLNMEAPKGFAKASFEDELEKAILIVKDELKYKAVIQAMEDFKWFEGSIHNFMGLIEKYPDKAVEFATNIFLESKFSLVARALLSIDDYSVRFGGSRLGDRYHFGSSNNWNTILTYKPSNNYKPYGKLIIKLFEHYKDTTGNSIDERLESLINVNLKGLDKHKYIYYFVKYESMMSRPTLNYTRENSDFTIRMLNTATLQAAHINPYYYAVAKRLGLNQDDEKNVINDSYSQYSECGALVLPNKFALIIDKDGNWFVTPPEGLDWSSIKDSISVAGFDADLRCLPLSDALDNYEDNVVACTVLCKELISAKR